MTERLVGCWRSESERDGMVVCWNFSASGREMGCVWIEELSD